MRAEPVIGPNAAVWSVYGRLFGRPVCEVYMTKRSQGFLFISLLLVSVTWVACGDVGRKGGKARGMPTDKNAKEAAEKQQKAKVASACEEINTSNLFSKKQEDSKFMALQLKLLAQATQLQKIGLRKAMKNEKMEQQQTAFEVLAHNMKSVINADGTRIKRDERDQNCTGLSRFDYKVTQTAEVKSKNLPVVVDFYQSDCRGENADLHAKFSFKDPLAMRIEIVQSKIHADIPWSWSPESKKKNLVCDMDFNRGGRLLKMNCENLAAGLSDESGVLFQKFNYDAERKNSLLQLAGQVLKSKETSRKFCENTASVCNITFDPNVIKFEEFCIYSDKVVDTNLDPEQRFLNEQNHEQQEQNSEHDSDDTESA